MMKHLLALLFLMVSSNVYAGETYFGFGLNRNIDDVTGNKNTSEKIGAYRVEHHFKYFAVGAHTNDDLNTYAFVTGRLPVKLSSRVTLAPFIGPSIYYANVKPNRGKDFKVHTVGPRVYYGFDVKYKFNKFILALEWSHVTDMRGKNMYGWHSWDNSSHGQQVLVKVSFF